MKRIKDLIILHDPGLSSYNIGDEIISTCIREELSKVINNKTVLSLSTHLPLSYRYLRTIKSPRYQFVCGSNLLKSSFLGIKRQWDITLRNSIYINNLILVGVGIWQYNNKINMYTKLLYKRILSKKYLHSVRDEYTKDKLKSIGISNVLNTGCPTLWRFTSEFCEKINQKKSKNVIFTITDYNQDFDKDIEMINILFEKYDKVYFFPQGGGDIEYLKKLGYRDKVILIPPSLKAYDNFLKNNNDIDYIGTRLHGGIRAMHFYRRCIIISIDNRAKEMSDNFNLPILEREEIGKLLSMIDTDILYDIKIPTEQIIKWKEQFYG
ncbi:MULTISPECIES: polysaccharide pyruvyl transferase family protein [Thomasclavelia]|uniref:polysaccharide pyruvyl transferase family protein n=1 Tax=Thomasclavelia TaxID=3025755 RepID=UPI003208B33F